MIQAEGHVDYKIIEDGDGNPMGEMIYDGKWFHNDNRPQNAIPKIPEIITVNTELKKRQL